MKLGIEINGVLRDTISKFKQLYEKNLIESQDVDSQNQIYNIDDDGNLDEAILNFKKSAREYLEVYPERKGLLKEETPLLISRIFL